LLAFSAKGNTCRKSLQAVLRHSADSTANHTSKQCSDAGLRLSAPGCCFTTAVAICRLNRYLQYGIKFWFGTSAVMAVCLSLSADVAAILGLLSLFLVCFDYTWMCSSPVEIHNLVHCFSFLLQPYWHVCGFAALCDVIFLLQTLSLAALWQMHLCHAVLMVSGTCLP